MWRERNHEHPNYARIDYVWYRHHERFVVRAEREGLACQACGGRGGEVDVIDPEIGGPWEPCGWCEGTGFVTRWLRGLWLRAMQKEKRNVPNQRRR